MGSSATLELPQITFPPKKRGRPTKAKSAQLEETRRALAVTMLGIRSRLSFSPGSRGWCYILEERAGLTKGDFDRAQQLITECRKRGLLPLDICADDERHEFHCVQEVFEESPEEHADRLIKMIRGETEKYFPWHFWDDQEHYCQMIVEKEDLVSLFEPVCYYFFVPIANTGGWSRLGTRAKMMERFKHWEEQGKQPVLLYCGDHDPGGLKISRHLRSNLEELSEAVGWEPGSLIIDRFGLNKDFIDEHGLPWIENLVTSSGEDLADPNHGQHNDADVQQYIETYGARKVEANALVIRPEAGRELCVKAIMEYVEVDSVEAYRADMKAKQRKLRDVLRQRIPGTDWPEPEDDGRAQKGD